MAQASDRGPSGQTRRFALFGGAIIVAVCIGLAVLGNNRVEAGLGAMAERNNIALTRAFSNMIWPRYADFLAAAFELPVEALRVHPATLALRRDVLAAMKGLSVVKVKVYDLRGLTVFSTDPSQIGDDKSGNTGLLSARDGRVVSELTHRDSFSAFEQTVEDLDVLSSYVPIRDAAGRIVGVFEIYDDVTSLLYLTRRSQALQMTVAGGAFGVLYALLLLIVWRNERRGQAQHKAHLELVRAAAVAEEASRVKSNFLAQMSHELRTPLNAILGFSEVVKAQLYGPVGSTRYLDYANDIWASGIHLLALVDEVLDMAKVETGGLTLDESEFDLDALVRASVLMVEARAREARIRLSMDLSRSVPRLYADEQRVKQILVNLLANAIGSTPKDGSVTLVLDPAGAGGLRITVADTGAGLDPSTLAMTLTPFGQIDSPYAARDTGTGLGLPIAKALAEAHGARFEVAGTPGQGTTIHVTFPAHRLRGAPLDGARPAAVVAARDRSAATP